VDNRRGVASQVKAGFKKSYHCSRAGIGKDFGRMLFVEDIAPSYGPSVHGFSLKGDVVSVAQIVRAMSPV